MKTQNQFQLNAKSHFLIKLKILEAIYNFKGFPILDLITGAYKQEIMSIQPIYIN